MLLLLPLLLPLSPSLLLMRHNKCMVRLVSSIPVLVLSLWRLASGVIIST